MASGLRTPDTPGDPGGLIVMVRPDPADAARALADDLHAELAIGGLATEQALARLETRQLEHRDLDALAAAMRRAEAVHERTRELASKELSASLNTKVAIHPDTLRRAAAEVIASEAALAAAVAADDRRAARHRKVRAGSLATVVAGAGVGLVVPPAGLAVAGLGLVGALASWRRPVVVAEERHCSLRNHCVISRARWEQVAGAGADPTQLDDIVRRYDPQDDVVGSLLGEHPAVRAAARVAVERRLAWVAAWREEVGDATPVADPALAGLLQRDRTELWLTAGTELEGVGGETLVVAAPYADLPEDRARQLHRRLLDLPRGKRVIVVLAPDPDAPAGVRIPGVGWVPATAGSAD